MMIDERMVLPAKTNDPIHSLGISHGAPVSASWRYVLLLTDVAVARACRGMIHEPSTVLMFPWYLLLLGKFKLHIRKPCRSQERATIRGNLRRWTGLPSIFAQQTRQFSEIPDDIDTVQAELMEILFPRYP